ncbi:hypothetical protein K440DRAFT_663917 [Wilcoxina mikolae CBS 423.85]|nr:hypothetical protein K440DRAFT_663917 [Wilcoxina mikolae CBS 423.85]
MVVRARKNGGYKPQPAPPEVMMHYLDTIASPKTAREGLAPAFTTLLELVNRTHYRSTTGNVIVWVGKTSLTYNNGSFTDKETGRTMGWPRLSSFARSQGYTVAQIEVETGTNGDCRMRLQRLRSQLGMDIFEAVRQTMKALPEVAAVNGAHITREDGSKVRFVFVLRPWTGKLKATPIQLRLLVHNLALCRLVSESHAKIERGQLVINADLEIQGQALPPLEPGDSIFPCIDDGANIVLGGDVCREYGTIGCFVSKLDEDEEDIVTDGELAFETSSASGERSASGESSVTKAYCVDLEADFKTDVESQEVDSHCQDEDESSHLLLTVCHNFKDGDKVHVTNKCGKEFLVDVPDPFRCIAGVPRYVIRASMADTINSCPDNIPENIRERLGSQIGFQEFGVKDLGVLVPPSGIPINCVLGKCCPFQDPDLDTLRPHSLPMEVLIEYLGRTSLTVYKKGATTGITSGQLFEVLCEQFELPEAQENDCRQSECTMGRIKWCAADTPFAKGGDSGALVWANIQQKIVPIGVHKGSRGDNSYCLLIESCFNVPEGIYNADYVFCSEARCEARL